MNLRNILKIYALERDLNPDDLALLNTLRAMSDTERAMTVEAFGGSMGKSGRGVSSAKPKKFPKCDVCGVSRRAAHHKDTTHKDYHEFDAGKAGGAGKSARASSLRERIQPVAQAAHKPLLCDYSVDGKVCHGEENDGIHDQSMGYAAYHEFQPPVRSVGAGGQV